MEERWGHRTISLLFTWLQKERRKYRVSILPTLRKNPIYPIKTIVHTLASRADKEIDEKLPVVNLTCNQNYVQYLFGKRFKRLVNLKSNKTIVCSFDVYFIALCFRVPILILHFVIPSCRDNNVRTSFYIHPSFLTNHGVQKEGFLLKWIKHFPVSRFL